ncbi:MAG: hypothetical protein ACREEA_06765 [Stellaceae bacterium]
MADRESGRERADGRTFATGKTFDREQNLMLLRGQAGALGGVFAEHEKPA